MIQYTTARSAIALVAGFGASKIVGEVIRNNTSVPDSAINKVLIHVGTYTIGGIICEIVRSKTADNVDELRDAVVKIKTEIQEAKTK